MTFDEWWLSPSMDRNSATSKDIAREAYNAGYWRRDKELQDFYRTVMEKDDASKEHSGDSPDDNYPDSLSFDFMGAPV